MMEPRLWRRLPFEVVQRVLSFLPVPDLCRCRAVCKRWNSLICRPNFGTLCRQNARRGFGYIVARVVEESLVDETKTNFGWSILDLEAQRWYRIKHDHALGEVVTLCSTVSGCVATDGGLVCESMLWDTWEPFNVTIYNPLLEERIVKCIPDPPEHLNASRCSALLNLVYDDNDNSFRVFFINQDFEHIVNSSDSEGSEDSEDYDLHGSPKNPLGHVVMHIYESTTDQWRSSTNPPLPSEFGVDDHGSSVIFQGLLYVLFSCSCNGYYWLSSYNVLEDLWEDTGVHIRNKMIDSPQLIVSDNRLFLLTWTDGLDELSDSFYPSLRVSEILLADVALLTLFQLTRVVVQIVFHIEETGCIFTLAGIPNPHKIPEFQGFGFGKSILLMSRKTGISIVYNLVTRSWSQIPTNPMEPLPSGCELWYGKTMNLSLPRRRRKKKSVVAVGVNGEGAVPS